MKYFLYLITIASGFLIVSCAAKKEKVTESTSVAIDSADAPTAINTDSCKNGTFIKYAHNYNNFIIENQGFILEDNINFIKAIKAHESKEKVTELYDRLIGQTNHSIDTLRTLCAFNGNEGFKNAAIDLFSFYGNVWDDYKALLDIDDKKDRAKILDNIKAKFNDKHSIKEKKLEEKFAMMHSKFSNEYKLHIRSTYLHDTLDSLLHLR